MVANEEAGLAAEAGSGWVAAVDSGWVAAAGSGSVVAGWVKETAGWDWVDMPAAEAVATTSQKLQAGAAAAVAARCSGRAPGRPQ